MKSIILLSGGLDSSVALAMSLTKDPESRVLEALTIDYGQRHRLEIIAAEWIANHYGIPWKLVTVDPQIFRGSALTGDAEVPEGHAESPDDTYVPARNTVLIALAAARAESIGARMIVIGANADDAAGYPDCRAEYLQAYRNVLQQGTINKVWLSAPLLHHSKDQIIELGHDLDVPMNMTYSCYRGEPEPCGTCGACIGRESLC